jgi:RNA polymerase sigma-70 factor (ECF subfamily)
MNTTPASLLMRLREPGSQGDAWSRFVTLYTPLLLHWVRGQGFTGAEEQDLVQDIFVGLLGSLPRFEYDPGRSFRAWLKTVAVNKCRERRRAARPVALPLQEGLAEGPEAADPAEEFWEREYREHLVRRALLLMQTDFPEKTWRACWQMVVEGRSAAEVAAEQQTTAGAVHAARFRVLARLREELAGLLD